MGQSVKQSFVRIVDSDIYIAEGNSFTLDTSVLVVYHTTIPLGTPLIVEVDGIQVETGEPGSNSDYEIKRMTETMTILYTRLSGSKSVVISGATVTEPPVVVPPSGGQGIGAAVIGSTFVVG